MTRKSKLKGKRILSTQNLKKRIGRIIKHITYKTNTTFLPFNTHSIPSSQTDQRGPIKNYGTSQLGYRMQYTKNFT